MYTRWLHCYNRFFIHSGLECLIVCSNMYMQLMSVQIFLPDSMKVKKGGNYPYICQWLTWLATFLTSLGALKWKSLQKTCQVVTLDKMLWLVSILFIVHTVFTLATYICMYVHYTHHTYKPVTACSIYSIVAVINMHWHLHQHSPLFKWSWSFTVCTCILNPCIMLMLVFVYFLHNDTFACMQVQESPTRMTKIQCTKLNKLCISSLLI